MTTELSTLPDPQLEHDDAVPAPADRPSGRDVGRAVLAIVAVVLGLWLGTAFIRDLDAPGRLVAGILDLVGADGSADEIRAEGFSPVWSKLIIAVVALAIGVLGIWALYWSANSLVTLTSRRTQRRLLPWVFLGPALLLLAVFLLYPIVDTIRTSLTEDVDGVGFGNYEWAFTDPELRVAFRNNVLWLVVGTLGSVAIGLLVATLVDRIKREALAKTFIFLPLVISFVGAAVIWRFVYAWRPEGEEQIGLLNAVGSGLGQSPVAWTVETPLNTFALIVIMIWLQTGFAMVVFSAAIKGIPSEIIEAARIDGANERQLFFRVVLPMIRGTILTVGTVVFIAILKVFDIVFVMTGGRFDTEVVANRMFSEMFTFRRFGRASTLAVLLLVVVIPFMVVNVRNLRRQGIQR